MIRCGATASNESAAPRQSCAAYACLARCRLSSWSSTGCPPSTASTLPADAAARQHGWLNARRTLAASSEEQRGDEFASAGDANFGKDVAEYSCVVYLKARGTCYMTFEGEFPVEVSGYRA